MKKRDGEPSKEQWETYLRTPYADPLYEFMRTLDIVQAFIQGDFPLFRSTEELFKTYHVSDQDNQLIADAEAHDHVLLDWGTPVQPRSRFSLRRKPRFNLDVVLIGEEHPPHASHTLQASVVKMVEQWKAHHHLTLDHAFYKERTRGRALYDKDHFDMQEDVLTMTLDTGEELTYEHTDRMYGIARILHQDKIPLIFNDDCSLGDEMGRTFDPAMAAWKTVCALPYNHPDDLETNPRFRKKVDEFRARAKAYIDPWLARMGVCTDQVTASDYERVFWFAGATDFIVGDYVCQRIIESGRGYGLFVPKQMDPPAENPAVTLLRDLGHAVQSVSRNNLDQLIKPVRDEG